MAERQIVRAFDKARTHGYRYTYQTFRKTFILNMKKGMDNDIKRRNSKTIAG